MSSPHPQNSTVASVRLPLEVERAFKAHCAALGVTPNRMLLLAATTIADLGDLTNRADLRGTIRVLSAIPSSRIVLRAVARSLGIRVSGTDAEPTVTEKKGALLDLLGLKPKATDAEIAAAVQKLLAATAPTPPAEQQPEAYKRSMRFGGAPPATRVQPVGTSADMSVTLRANASKAKAASTLTPIEQHAANAITDVEHRARFKARCLAQRAASTKSKKARKP